MYLFEDQKFFLSVLRQTDFIRPDQALPLLRLFDPRKTQGQTEALIRQLRYVGELAFSGQLLCSPEMLKSSRTRRCWRRWIFCWRFPGAGFWR